MKWISKLLGGGDPLGKIANVVDKFVDTKEEKRTFFKEVYEMQAKEKASARALYGQDGLMQKVYAATFLLAYLGLTGWLIYSIIAGSIEKINQFETGLIGSIWGGMTAKVNTITDFFFGSADKNLNVK